LGIPCRCPTMVQLGWQLGSYSAPKGQSTAICIPPGVANGFFLSHHSTLIFLLQKETHCQLS
jgi:hypothetical protein